MRITKAKKALSLLLILAMVLAMVPRMSMTAFAADGDKPTLGISGIITEFEALDPIKVAKDTAETDIPFPATVTATVLPDGDNAAATPVDIAVGQWEIAYGSYDPEVEMPYVYQVVRDSLTLPANVTLPETMEMPVVRVEVGEFEVGIMPESTSFTAPEPATINEPLFYGKRADGTWNLWTKSDMSTEYTTGRGETWDIADDGTLELNGFHLTCGLSAETLIVTTDGAKIKVSGNNSIKNTHHSGAAIYAETNISFTFTGTGSLTAEVNGGKAYGIVLLKTFTIDGPSIIAKNDAGTGILADGLVLSGGSLVAIGSGANGAVKISTAPVGVNLAVGSVNIDGTSSVSVSYSDSSSDYRTADGTVAKYVKLMPLDKTEVTVSGVTVDSKVYDASPVIPGGTAVVSDSAADTNTLVYTYTSTDGGGYDSTTAPKNVGAYKLTVAFPDDSDYTGKQEITFSITAKELEITGLTATNRAYDTTTNVALTGGTLSGKIGDDDVFVTIPVNGTIADAGAGTSKTVTVTTPSLTGTAAANYTLKTISGITVNITKATPSISTWPTVTARYGQTLSQATIGSGTHATVGSFGFASGTTAVGNVGDNTHTLTFTPSDTANYETVTKDVVVTVAKADAPTPVVGALSVSNNVAKSYEYDLTQLLPTLATGLEFGTVTYTYDSKSESTYMTTDPTVSGAKLTVSIAEVTSTTESQFGTITIKINSRNYAEMTATINLSSVNKIPVDITANNYTKIYNGKAVTLDDITKSVTKSGVTGVWSFDSDSYDLTNANNGLAVTLKFTPTGAYAEATTSITVTINKAALVIKPKNVSVTQDGTMPNFELDYSGLVGSETVTPSESAKFTCSALNTNTAGVFDIIWTNADTTAFIGAENYSITKASKGTLTINKKTTPSNDNDRDDNDAENDDNDDNDNSSSGSSPTTTVTISADTKSGSTAVEITQTGNDVKLELPNSRLERIINNADDNVIFDLSEVKKAETAIIPIKAAEKLSDEGIGITVKLPAADITIAPNDLQEIAKGAKGNQNLRIEASYIDPANLTDAQKQAVNGKQVIDINVFLGNSKQDVPVTASIPYELGEGETADGVFAWYMDNKGNLTKITGNYDVKTGMFTFYSGHQSYYLIGYEAQKTQVSEQPSGMQQNSFSDINGHWAKNAIEYMVNNGIMNGTSAAKFEPDTNLNRAMMVQILFNLNGGYASGNANFDDVADDAWYTNAVTWAAENKIISGYGNGLFGPNDKITREQMAVMLSNYCEYKGISLPVVQDVIGFSDNAAISTWAVDAVESMYKAGILNGKDSNVFDPNGTATRAEVAQMIMNFIESVGNGAKP